MIVSMISGGISMLKIGSFRHGEVMESGSNMIPRELMVERRMNINK